MNLYYSTLVLCALVGLLSNSYLLHAIVWAVAMAVVLSKTLIENLCSNYHR